MARCVRALPLNPELIGLYLKILDNEFEFWELFLHKKITQLELFSFVGATIKKFTNKETRRMQ